MYVYVSILICLQELKQQNALLSETKVLLQDEVSELHSRLERLSKWCLYNVCKKYACIYMHVYMYIYCVMHMYILYYTCACTNSM